MKDHHSAAEGRATTNTTPWSHHLSNSDGTIKSFANKRAAEGRFPRRRTTNGRSKINYPDYGTRTEHAWATDRTYEALLSSLYRTVCLVFDKLRRVMESNNNGKPELVIQRLGHQLVDSKKTILERLQALRQHGVPKTRDQATTTHWGKYRQSGLLSAAGSSACQS